MKPTARKTDSKSELPKDRVRLWAHPKVQWKAALKDGRLDQTKASNWERWTAPLTDSKSDLPKDGVRLWAHPKVRWKAAPKDGRLDRTNCLAENLAPRWDSQMVRSEFQWGSLKVLS